MRWLPVAAALALAAPAQADETVPNAERFQLYAKAIRAKRYDCDHVRSAKARDDGVTYEVRCFAGGGRNGRVLEYFVVTDGTPTTVVAVGRKL